MTEYKLGDKVRILNVDEIDCGDECFRNGDVTEVVGFDGRNPELKRTIGYTEDDDRLFISPDEMTAIELVSRMPEGRVVAEPTPDHTAVEASPTVIELLANISRRLYEAEQTIKEQAYEINELYKAVADRG